MATAAVLALAVGVAPASAHPRPGDKVAVAVGSGGAVATVDADATRVGLDVLRRGGNAVDAAVAAAATLGVTEPFSSGIGGGGFFVYYDAASGQVHTIDGRETAPAAMRADAFVENGVPIPFADAVTSGLSVGVPGTPRDLGERAGPVGHARACGQALAGRHARSRAGASWSTRRSPTRPTTNADPVRRLPVDRRSSTCRAAPRPRSGRCCATATWPTRTTCWPARRRRAVHRAGSRATSSRPCRTRRSRRRSTLVARPGLMELGDLAAYQAPLREPTHVSYRGLDVYGMAPPSSGGSTVGEALNILETADLAALGTTQAQHRYLEASALAFADRNRYVGDPAFVDVPLAELLSDGFAAERACLIDPTAALVKPVAPGSPDGHVRRLRRPPPTRAPRARTASRPRT